MLSIILTSANEPKTIGKAISCLINPDYSGYKGKLELILAIPDRITMTSALRELKDAGFTDYMHIQDPGTGKPAALNLAISRAKGDIIVFTDGDVYLGKGTLGEIVNNFKEYPQMGGFSGRQFSMDTRKNMFGYFSHLFAEALAVVRSPMQGGNPQNKFFPMSGYVMGVRASLLDFKLPDDVLVDDGYISYMIYNKGFTIGYSSQAAAFVSYAKSSEDYYKQKVRSTGGYLQLKKYGIMKGVSHSRGIGQDLQMATFPLKFARNPKEFVWSLLLYGLRFNLWLRIFMLRFFNPSKLYNSWKRVESTK